MGFVGGKPGVSPPPWTPYESANICPRCMKMFLGNLECICWSGRPKFLADLHSGQNYKRLKKKLLKMMSFVLPHMNRSEMAESSHKQNFGAFLIKIVAINSYFTKKIENNAKKWFFLKFQWFFPFFGVILIKLWCLFFLPQMNRPITGGNYKKMFL